jgi:hypothetical protein
LPQLQNYALKEVNMEFEEKLKNAEQQAEMANKKVEIEVK